MKFQKVFKSFVLVTISLIFSLILISCVGDKISLPKIDPNINKTLLGIDSNKNGIRDDVEVAIYNRYPTNKQMRQVAYQLAIADQKKLEVVSKSPIDERAAKNVSINFTDKAVSCTNFHSNKTGNEINTGSLFKFIDAIVFNTRERKDAYFKFPVNTIVEVPITYNEKQPCDYVGNW